MKMILFALAVFSSIAINGNADKDVSQLYTLNASEFYIEFNTTWTWEDFVLVTEDLKAHHITLTLSLLEFDESGHLKKMYASIEYADGMRGSFRTNDLESGKGPHFRRDLKKFPFPEKE